MTHLKHDPNRHSRDPLNLRGLPPLVPPADGWPAIRTAMDSYNRRRRLGYAAGLAALLVLVAGLAMLRPFEAPGVPPGSGAPEVAADVAPDGVAESRPDERTLGTLIAVSQQLEKRLRAVRGEAGDLPTEALAYQVELEDLVAQVDEELSMHPQALQLWNQRVRLLLDMNRLYEDQLRRNHHLVASL